MYRARFIINNNNHNTMDTVNESAARLLHFVSPCPLSFLLLLFPFFGWTKLNDGASIWTDSRALTVNLCTHIFAMRCAFHMNINSDLICAPHRTLRIFFCSYTSPFVRLCCLWIVSAHSSRMEFIQGRKRNEHTQNRTLYIKMKLELGLMI